MYQPRNQKEKQIRAKADGGYVYRRADVPATVLCDVTEKEERRVGRADKEHIYRSSRRLPTDDIDQKSHDTKRKKRDSRQFVILLRVSSSARKNKKKTYENEDEVPEQRYRRQGWICVKHARGLKE